MQPFTVRLRFHGDLNVFLRLKRSAQPAVERQLTEKTSIKDIIESCGVPHPEVDLILIDRQTVGFDQTLVSDAKVDVFPFPSRSTEFT